MEPNRAQRSNEAWLAALRAQDTGAIAELAAFLRRTLGKVLRDQRRVHEDDLADFTQEALLRIVESLDSFRGDARFTTWATAVATRVAFTELRRRGVRERGRAEFDEAVADARSLGSAPNLSPDEAVSKGDLLAALEHAIATDLTERQRVAILAELRGVPTVEIAAQLDTNSNALYKLHHDARKKLRAALVDRGFDPEDIRRQIMETSRR